LPNTILACDEGLLDENYLQPLSMAQLILLRPDASTEVSFSVHEPDATDYDQTRHNTLIDLPRDQDEPVESELDAATKIRAGRFILSELGYTFDGLTDYAQIGAVIGCDADDTLVGGLVVTTSARMFETRLPTDTPSANKAFIEAHNPNSGFHLTLINSPNEHIA